ncbi:hypothetical protein KJ966_18675 [bacterium]|nr:hypothetical protein [bacterium]
MELLQSSYIFENYIPGVALTSSLTPGCEYLTPLGYSPRIIEGQEVIIARGNKPVGRLEVLSEAHRKRRIGGIKKG